MRVCGKDSIPFPYDLILGGFLKKCLKCMGNFLQNFKLVFYFGIKLATLVYMTFSILSIVPLKLTKLDIFYLTHCSVKCA